MYSELGLVILIVLFLFPYYMTKMHWQKSINERKEMHLGILNFIILLILISVLGAMNSFTNT